MTPHTGPGRDPVAAAVVAAAVDELTALVLDDLGPTVVAHRREIARRAGLEPDDLIGLDRLRRLGPLPAPAVAEWMGLTRSAMSKAARRLETGGHLERTRVPGRRQEIELSWCPHPERDAVLARARHRVRADIQAIVAGQRLGDPDRLAVVAAALAAIQNALHRHTRELTDARAYAALVEQRRLRRAAMPDPAAR